MNTNFERYHQSVISGIILIQVVSFDIINDPFYGSYLQAFSNKSTRNGLFIFSLEIFKLIP